MENCELCEALSEGKNYAPYEVGNLIARQLCEVTIQLNSLIEVSGGETSSPTPHSFTTGTALTIPAGAYSVAIEVKSGTAIINGLSYPTGYFKLFTADGSRPLPEIIVSGTTTIAWERMI